MCLTISAPKNMSGSKIIPTGIIAIINAAPTTQTGTTIQEVTMANISLQIISNIIFIFVFIVLIPLFFNISAITGVAPVPQPPPKQLCRSPRKTHYPKPYDSSLLLLSHYSTFPNRTQATPMKNGCPKAAVFMFLHQYN